MSRAAIILDSDFQRKKAADWVWALKDGTRVEFKGPKRTLDQNSLFWVLLTEVAVQLKWHGQKLTPDDWKLQFLDALRRSKREELHIVPNTDNTGFVNLSTSSSDLSKEEMTELIELIFAFGAAHGVTFNTSNAPAAANDAGSPTNLPDDTSQAPSGEALADPSPLGEQSSSVSNPSQDDPQAGAAATNSDEAIQQAMVPDAEPDSAGDPASKSAAGAPNSAEEGTSGRKPESSVDSSGAGTSQGAGTAATESSGEEEKAAGEGYGAVSPPAAELSQADLDWLKLGAHWMLAALPADDPEALRVLLVQVAEIRKVMPKDVSADARARMETMRIHCRQVCDGKEKLDKRFMAKTAMTTPAEIEPKTVTVGKRGNG